MHWFRARIACPAGVMLAMAPAFAFGLSASAATPAVDAAWLPEYEDGWDPGDDGGGGWLGGWAFSNTPINAGVAIGSSTLNGDGDSDGDGDIDIDGKAFLLVTSAEGALVQAIRTLDGPLSVGQELALDIDIDPESGAPGFRLSSASALRFGFQYSTFLGSFQAVDADGYRPLGIAGTDEDLRVSFRTTGADAYELHVTGTSGATAIYTGTLLGSGGITSLSLRALGEDASIRVHAFNLLVVPEPAGGASALASLAALLVVVRVARRGLHDSRTQGTRRRASRSLSSRLEEPT